MMTTYTNDKILVVLIGPTAVGKTDTSIAIARHYNTEIISADSRQFFKEMSIGTAVPDSRQLEEVKHHFIQNLSIDDKYSSYDFEQDTLALLENLFQKKDIVVLTGGSMLYIDAICEGIDEIPTISKEIREKVEQDYEENGLTSLQLQLKELDPKFYEEVDLLNPKRVMHAVEVCLEAGEPYSNLRKGEPANRPFTIVKIGLNREREELYDRINRRVDIMIEEGLEEEAKNLHPKKGLNALKTVGYKELFGYFEGEYDKNEAIRLIKRNTRYYAKRQLSWFRRDEDIQWFHPKDIEQIIKFIEEKKVALLTK
ncbi:tRNA (adenosine(37)-N6)-dimethylallyltransferase MiaA [Balneicella halophila]|nr:tRNA (adenosine(37)-N6)-dimethylallyltransferase MiaA [Balneicella halophila]